MARFDEMEEGVEYISNVSVALGAEDEAVVLPPVSARRWKTVDFEICCVSGSFASGDLVAMVDTAISQHPRAVWNELLSPGKNLEPVSGAAVLFSVPGTRTISNLLRLRIQGKIGLASRVSATFEIRWSGKERAQ